MRSSAHARSIPAPGAAPTPGRSRPRRFWSLAAPQRWRSGISDRSGDSHAKLRLNTISRPPKVAGSILRRGQLNRGRALAVSAGDDRDRSRRARRQGALHPRKPRPDRMPGHNKGPELDNSLRTDRAAAQRRRKGSARHSRPPSDYTRATPDPASDRHPSRDCNNRRSPPGPKRTPPHPRCKARRRQWRSLAVSRTRNSSNTNASAYMKAREVICKVARSIIWFIL